MLKNKHCKNATLQLIDVCYERWMPRWVLIWRHLSRETEGRKSAGGLFAR
jgi:hypothetical protein